MKENFKNFLCENDGDLGMVLVHRNYSVFFSDPSPSDLILLK